MGLKRRERQSNESFKILNGLVVKKKKINWALGVCMAQCWQVFSTDCNEFKKCKSYVKN